ncbi:hypothetical protein KCU71_g9713, partial [Aureobasidium melanogenum]
MRFADASLATACFVQLFATAWGLPPLDQLLSDSPDIDNGFSGPPLHVYAQPAWRKRQTTTASTSAATSSGSSVASSSSSSSSGIYTNSTISSTMSSPSSSMSSSANLTTSSTSSSTSSTSSYANSTSSTASSTTSSSTTASASPTTVMGVTFNIQNNTIYSGTLLNLMRKRAADSGIDMCLNKCASNSSCQGTAYDNTTSTCTYYSSVDQSSQMTKTGTTFALVQNRASNTTSNSTTSAPSSTMTMSLNSTSSLSRSRTRHMNTTSSHSMTMTANSTSSHLSTMSSNTTSSTSATPTNLVGARSCKQIAAAGSTFTDSNNVTYAVICSKMQKRMLLDESALSPRAAGDLATIQSGSFEGCAPYCDQNLQCNSYSYDPTNGTCYLESTSSVTQPIAGRDYAYKVQSTTSSSSTSSSSSSTLATSSTTPSSTSSSSTSSSSTSNFLVLQSATLDDYFAVLHVFEYVAFSSDKNRHRTVQTVVSQQTVGAVVTSYSVVSSGNTVTIVDTATSVLSVYTSTMQVASLRRSTVTTVQSAQPSVMTVGAVTVTTDVVIPSGYTTVTASGSTVTQNIDRTVATGVATVTAPASTVTTTVATLTTSGASTVTSGISTVTMNAAAMSFSTVWRREEKPSQDDKTEEKKGTKDEEKRDRPWFAFDGTTDFWM